MQDPPILYAPPLHRWKWDSCYLVKCQDCGQFLRIDYSVANKEVSSDHIVPCELAVVSAVDQS